MKLSHRFLTDGIDGIRKLLKHSQLHEIVLIIAMFLVVLVLFVSDVFFLCFTLDSVKLEDFVNWEELTHDVFRQGPDQEPSKCEDYGGLRAFPQTITINGPDLVLSSHCGTLRSSNSVEWMVMPTKYAHIPRKAMI